MGSKRWTEYMRLDEVNTADRNPKLHDTTGIARSVSHHGFVETPTLDERTGKLVAGHGRLADLQARMDDGQGAPDGVDVAEDGMFLVPVSRGWSSRSDADATAYLIASNRLTENGGVDEHEMTEMLGDLAGDNLLDLTGYDAGDLEALEALYGNDDGPAGPNLGTNPFDDEDDDGDDLDAELDALDDALGKGKVSDLWPAVRITVPPQLNEAWKSHLDLHGGDEVAAFAKLLDVDPATLPDPDEEP